MVNQLTASRWQNRPTPFGRMTRDMDQLLGSLVHSLAGNGNDNSQQAWYASAALWEDANSYHVEIDLPGVEKENLSITFEAGVLLVAAERKAPEGERKYWHNERAYGKIERRFSLPDLVDENSVEAEFRSGVLFVRLAKKPEAQPKRIEVKVS